MASFSKTPAAKAPLLGSATTEGIVIIKVGPDGVKYHFHKSLLVHHSEYFRKALSGPWKEAEGDLVTLDDVEPCIVTLFVHWLYTQQLPLDNNEWVRMEIVEEKQYWRDEWLHVCFKAYVFGDRFLVPKLSRVVNNLFAETLNSCYYSDKPGLLSACYAFDKIPSNCIILQCLVDLYCAYYSPSRLGYDLTAMDVLPLTFL
ncbi:hypothetical protein CC86DRAFT_12548 [Ophiobolus disseminans]|uniref:BTB domain-containing protein n=1 Tax=Ophiobolus disseminans TaxID=1469910 RepID=A0A6A7AKF3_9PLEO|nr:hypothetical protein CC86DRAFT_12548 [Ophiobolus disseminans]